MTKEVERFDPYRSSPHRPARWGIPLALAGVLVLAGSVAIFFLADLFGPLQQALTGGLDPSLALLGSLFLVGGGLYVVGSGLIWLAYWRCWQTIQAHERELRYDSLNPGLMMILWVGSFVALGVLPLIGWAVQLGARAFVLYRTQRGLNRVWTATQTGYETHPPRSRLGAIRTSSVLDHLRATPGRVPHSSRASPPRPAPLPTHTDRPRPMAPPQPGGPFTCEACGNRERVPQRRPLRVVCPRCGEDEVLRGGP